MNESELNASILSRLQWSGIKGAPTSNMFWVDYRFAGNKSAVGMNVNLTSYGETKITDVLANYSYTIRVSDRFKLAMGLRAGVSMMKINPLPADKIWDENDRFKQSSFVNQNMFLTGCGFRLTDKRFYVGLSAPDLITYDKYNVYGNDGKSFFAKKRNYSVVSGYKIQLTDAYALSPNLMVLYYPQSKVRTDLNANFEIRDYFWAGATYSTSYFHSFIVGAHVSSTLRASYAFQFGLGRDIPSKFFTHEIGVILNLDARKK